MRVRNRLAIAGSLILLLACTTGQIVTAQSPSTAGRDLEGMWDANTMTPLQRPTEFASKPKLTPEEAAEYERTFFDRNAARLGPDAALQVDLNDVFVIPPKLDDFRTSLVVDPADGRMPPTVPAASTRLFKRSFDDPESLNLVERCLVGEGMGVLNGNVSLASPPARPGDCFR